MQIYYKLTYGKLRQRLTASLTRTTKTATKELEVEIGH